jgi:large subunit ribosomal protein L9
MKVILLHEIENLGRKGEIIRVKDGYARNYLIPKKLALYVSKTNIKMIEERRKKLEKEREREIKTVEEFKNRIEKLKVVIKKKAGEEDTLFGSVTSSDIEEALKAEDIEVEKKNIIIPEHIKKLGEYSIDIRIHPSVKAQLNIVVEKEEE